MKKSRWFYFMYIVSCIVDCLVDCIVHCIVDCIVDCVVDCVVDFVGGFCHTRGGSQRRFDICIIIIFCIV